MRAEEEPIAVDDEGHEHHPSWITIRAGRVQTTGTTLFDSEIVHREYVSVTVSECWRRRELNQDWIHSTRTIMEINMSLAQWGAFVSSFGNGGGVPVTLVWNDGEIPPAPHVPRLTRSMAEVKNATGKATEEIKSGHAALVAAFEAGAGKREMRKLINDLGHVIGNAPLNMNFAAKSLTEHVENTIAKARADVEGMVLAHAQTLGLETGDFAGILALDTGTTDPEETT